MIAERFPELRSLNPEEQLELASELAKEAMSSADASNLTRESVNLLEERLDYFLKHPESGVNWEALRSKKDA